MEVKKAGCILIDVYSKKIGLIYRKKQKDYSFPKGHLEIGETFEECAVRETEEETGRKCKIIPTKPLPILVYKNTEGDAEVHYYIARDNGKSSVVFDPELVHELVWKEKSDIKSTLTYPNLVELWNQAEPIINDIFMKN